VLWIARIKRRRSVKRQLVDVPLAERAARLMRDYHIDYGRAVYQGRDVDRFVLRLDFAPVERLIDDPKNRS
jgi:hypothetical protein